MPTLTVGQDPDTGHWSIVIDGEEAEPVRGHYDAYEVLLIAESRVAGDVLWRLMDDGGFEAVISPEA